MPVPLPNLDDRRFADLVDEALARIPVQAPGWTDYNASDPGITLIELLAWITDGDIYRANRIPDSHIRQFLSLLGVAPEPPHAACAPVQFTLNAGAAQLYLPATLELDALMLDGKAGKFRLRSGLSVLPCALAAVQIQSGRKFRDVTADWSHGQPIAVFGADPEPGDTLYLGFNGSLQSGDMLSLYVGLAGENASAAARQRILEELQSRMQACLPWDTCAGPTADPQLPELPPHHSARVIWEAQTQPGLWQPLSSSDDTRSMTLSGGVTLQIDAPPVALRTGAVVEALLYLRCRFLSGSFDDAPRALRIFENAVVAEQSSPLWEQWPIAAGVVALGTPPVLGQVAALRVDFNASGRISSLDFNAAESDALRVVVLAYKPATAAQPGALTVEALRIGAGTGAPNQLLQLGGFELSPAAFSLYTLENGALKPWMRVESFIASSAADPHYVMGAGLGEVLLGDGQNGRVAPAGVIIIAIAQVTRGAAGNVAAGAIGKSRPAGPTTVVGIDIGPHNAALLDVNAAVAALALTANPDAAFDGAEEETLAHAEGRAAALLAEPERAVTLDDCKVLALRTPGTAIARAAAIANYCPSLQCYSAPGYITVMIAPYLPLGRPVPSPGLLQAVSAYLNRRRVIGSRIEVTGPDYLEVAVHAAVKAATGESKAGIQSAVIAALSRFLDPLGGGPDGTGWPLGRAVYISEILDTIAGVPGVDHVISLQLEAAGCGLQCGDICLNPLALAVSGPHVVEVS